MMRVLITGCGGFIGSHLADLLVDRGEVFGTVYDFDGRKNIEHLGDRIKIIKCDMGKRPDVENVVAVSKPDVVFHMAAQSFVVPSWENQETTYATNFMGTYYLLEALKEKSPHAKIVVACSSAEYGFVTNNAPLTEESPLRPSSPYAVSKVGQDMLSYLYWKAYGMDIVRVRLFNTTGPRKTFDACSDFARGIAEVESGVKNVLNVGNLDGLRDISDVRDVVRGLSLLAERGASGEVYNICSGKAHRIGDVLKNLISMSKVGIKVSVKPDSKRKIDDPLFIGDNSKIRKLGWSPTISMEKTLTDTLEYWRKTV